MREAFAPLVYSIPGELLAAERAAVLGVPYFRDFDGGRTVEWADGASRIRDSHQIAQTRRAKGVSTMPDASEPTAPAFIAVGSIYLDDIVFPNGRTVMGVLGGGAAHAAAGMAIWGQRGGIVACVGRDLPEVRAPAPRA